MLNSYITFGVSASVSSVLCNVVNNFLLDYITLLVKQCSRCLHVLHKFFSVVFYAYMVVLQYSVYVFQSGVDLAGPYLDNCIPVLIAEYQLEKQQQIIMKVCML